MSEALKRSKESTASPYPEVEANPDFARMEEEIGHFWKEHQVFEASVALHPAKVGTANNEYIFYDGPPFANGLPHYGHLLTGFVKDMFARYHTMKGKRVERRFGWDCHGLPAEMGAEKELGISGRAKIMEFGIGKFNEHCRSSVMKYSTEWEHYVTRQGRWVDFGNDYKTMYTPYMESVIWAFKQLYDKGLVYESMRVMPYSWAAETPLSNFETKLDNSYREREDKAITVAFELKEAPKGAPKAEKYYVLAWTTTPWTLPSNLALAVNAEMEYACVVTHRSPLAGEHDAPMRIGGGKTDFATSKAQEMRKEPTEAEKKLWLALNKEQLGGFKFRRQQPIGNYIADFYNAEKRLVVELDGGQHAENQDDKKRTEWLESQGLKVLRFWNNDVLQNTEAVLQNILDVLQKTPHAVSGETAAPPQGGSVCYILARAVADSSKYRKELGLEVEAGENDKSLSSKKEFDEDISESQYPWRLYKGTDLLGLSYEPLFPYFEKQPNAFKIIDGSSFVTDADGTGIVHIAPGFGEDDQRVGEANDIGMVVPVDGQGKYTDEIFDLPDLKLKGLNVIAENVAEFKFGEANERIIRWLKDHGHLIKQEQIKHNYPHCWRTDQPLIYRAMPSWYVEVTKFRDRAVELNKQINWIPEHVRDGQMGHMLATAPDWSISRNRFWGTPIPVWRSDNPENKELYVFGSIQELQDFFGVEVKDLHRPYIDELTKPDPKNPNYTLRRVTDVFDCWFESGSMPFAQVHYPFENKEWFEQHFPADFITEYVGQTRGWFNTLIMLSTALFDKPPFKNCVCHGVVLDAETGLKYSKRLKNYKDPLEVINQFGADALRWLMMASPVMRGQDLMVDPEGKFIRDVVRLAIKPIWNAYNFFTLYANADGVTATFDLSSSHVMDRYILSKMVAAAQVVEQALDDYDTPSACNAISDFFEILNNWYIRRSKNRFWKTEHDADKQAAYNTLYTALHVMVRLAAPLLPFVTEKIYQGLMDGSLLCKENSVHLAAFPSLKGATHVSEKNPLRFTEDEQLIRDMDRVRDICNAALSVRNAQNIRVRQPLSKLTVVAKENAFSKQFASIIEEEINVKLVDASQDFDAFATLKLSLNNPVLGKRLPEKMKQIIPASKKGEWKHLPDGGVEILGEKLLPNEYTLLLEPKPEYKNSAAPLSSNDALVVLDLTITPELEAEGIARDVVRMIQQARKDANLNVSDRIDLQVGVPPAVLAAILKHQAYVMEQTLAVSLKNGVDGAKYRCEHMLDDTKIAIGLSVAA